MSILDDLDAAEKAATPGPWQTGYVPLNCRHDALFFDSDHWRAVGVTVPNWQQACKDSDLIALSRNHLRALINDYRVMKGSLEDIYNLAPHRDEDDQQFTRIGKAVRRAREALVKLETK